ncbi:hypothetical protein [Bradyrhizobium sp. AS23.2]|uniref:hypothetical protein n=1 Tax=Bradyrhizobium sp. AS23.2 TaxID=1680155 RepID=UPI001FD88EF0|nr:hypothetical protein [Bradyrhizobium sp. AS23.2]
MAIIYDRLKNWPFPEITQTYTWKDTSFYALSVGMGSDPCAREQLKFIYEPWLQAMPTMASVLANPGFWVRHPDTGIDWANSLHGEQDIVLHRTLPPEGTIVGQMQVETLVDRGAGKGAIMTTRNDLRDRATNDLIASVYATAFMRTNGGVRRPSGAAVAAPRSAFSNS